MSTERQKKAAPRSIERAREVKTVSEQEANIAPLPTVPIDRLPADDFAFPEQRKEPLIDANHVRNAIARFDQVEGVTDLDRDHAWDRITAAAGQFGIAINEQGWRDLFEARIEHQG